MSAIQRLAERAVWVAAAAGISFVVAQFASNNSLIGPITPFVYLALRALQDVLDPSIPNK